MPHTFESLRKAVIAAVCHHVIKGERSIIVQQACATGKTKTELELAKAMGVKVAICMVPTLTLAAQHAKYIHAQKVLFVCSDRSVSSNPDHLVTLDIKVISEAIIEAQTSGVQLIIFCTYQSSDKFVDMYKEFPDTPKIELSIYDEAHYASQVNHGLFSCTLDDDAVNFGIRVFFTASPKESMLDGGFGVLAHSFFTWEAIQAGLVKDYYIVIATVTNADVAKLIKDEEVAKLAGLAIATAKAIKECDLSTLLSFHSTVAGARDMAKAWNLIKDTMGLGHIDAGYADGTMTAHEVRLELNRLKEGNYILCSCQVLGVGVDIPEVDGLVFSDPRESKISILQVVGRGQRNIIPPNSLPMAREAIKPVPVIMPTLLDDLSIQAKFTELIMYLRSLRVDDTAGAPDGGGKATINQVLSKVAGSISLVNVGDYIDQGFIDAIELQINRLGGGKSADITQFTRTCHDYDRFIGDNWAYPRTSPDAPEEERNLGRWASITRLAAKAGALSDEKTDLVKQIIPEFLWLLRKRDGEVDRGSSTFAKNLMLVGRYVRENGKCPDLQHPLSQWFKYVSKTIVVSPDQWVELNSKYGEWHDSLITDQAANFLSKMNKLKAFYDKHGHFPGSLSQDVDIDGIFGYVYHLRRQLVKGRKPERAEWLMANFPEFFTVPMQLFRSTRDGKQHDITAHYRIDLLPLAKFIAANNRLPTIAERDLYRAYKMLMLDYKNGNYPAHLELFIKLYLLK